MDEEDTYNIVQRGGVVTSSGYWWGKDFYFAYGTYPGCIRKTSEYMIEDFQDKIWKEVSELDIILQFGYRPDLFVRRLEKVLGRLEDDILYRLNNVLEDRLTVKHYKDPHRNAAMCQKIFKDWWGILGSYE